MSYRPLVRCTNCSTESTNQPDGDDCHTCLRGVMRLGAVTALTMPPTAARARPLVAQRDDGLPNGGGMQRIRFLSRRQAAELQPAPGNVLISIHDRSEPALTPRAGWARAGVRRFHDTDGSLRGLEVFSNEQALELLAFVRENQACPELTVHCQQGSSRSAAIALFFAEKFKVPCYQEKRLVTRDSWKFYNRMVYERLRMVDHAA